MICKLCGVKIFKGQFDNIYDDSILEDLCEEDRDATIRIMKHLGNAMAIVNGSYFRYDKTL